MTVPPRVTTVWSDTVRPEVCRHRQCGKPIVFAQEVKSGKLMLFDAPLVPLARQGDLEGRDAWTVDLETSHFIRCPGAPAFRRRRRS